MTEAAIDKTTTPSEMLITSCSNSWFLYRTRNPEKFPRAAPLVFANLRFATP